MHWNYRVVKTLVGTEESYGIHEVYYDSHDRPVYCSANPDPCYASSFKNLLSEVERFRQALNKPVLTSDDFVPVDEEVPVSQQEIMLDKSQEDG